MAAGQSPQALNGKVRTSGCERPDAGLPEQGDVVLLDNILSVHARNEFTGYRKILTAMAIAQKSADLDQE